ncbi:arsenate reductase (glutaredoxin) [Snuella lapsa]|uniref:Arsenate reductase (Glutaredoxin) n=1 Tax=Snuella lapsa TaxID=870481 RepID=A0ABP6Y2P8_9FLAO
MIKIFHNNRCSKSRNGLQILEQSGKPFEIVKYLEDTPSIDELKNIINLLNIAPIDLIRKNETIWKTSFKGKQLSDDEIIKAMVDNPKLIERPIVINGNEAVIGRPPELIKGIL